jgi:flavin-dependent dehydrogenase
MTNPDVIIIGGGPAGSTAGNLLARAGTRVLVIERELFPRFHIGESLLPCDLPVFSALGVSLDETAFMRKAGAEFMDERTGEHQVYQFQNALTGTPTHAYQVDRAAFDKLLLDKAREVGAEVHEGEAVKNVDLSEESVRVETTKGAYQARYCVDASGQDAFFARRAHTVAPIPDFGRAAVFTHFSDLSEAALERLGPDGNIKVLIIPDGWIWVIPLAKHRLSVGVVKRIGKATLEWVDQELARSPFLEAVTRDATRGPTRMIGNFSFKNTRPAGPRWVCIGDAGCFLDPVFSSGVSLAMLSAEHMSGRLLTALERGTEADPHLMTPLGEHMTRAYTSFGSLIHSFYHRRIVQNLFFSSAPQEELRSGLISILAGDVWRDDNRFQSLLLRADRWSAPEA